MPAELSADDILQLRLHNQHLATQRLDDPRALVSHFGGVQAQDYPAAQWALGLRLRNATARSMEEAFAAGAILRTHVLRPTWHFVAPADIRWLLELTAPRVKAAMRFYTNQLGLDDRLFDKADTVIASAAAGGKHLTRVEVGRALRAAGIELEAAGTSQLILRAELDSVICSGPKRGKQHTYALLDERVPVAPSKSREQALGELASRYFTSHGPATVRDFAWWSGLTISDCKHAIDLNGSSLVQAKAGGREYWFAPNSSKPARSDDVYLLPNYDEYTVAYRDRDLFYTRRRIKTSLSRLADVPFGNVIVHAGRVVGAWKRNGSHPEEVKAEWFDAPSEAQCERLGAALERYQRFVAAPV